MRIIGLDPGLGASGWGVIDVSGNHLRFVARGVVRTDAKLGLAQRLVQIHQGLAAVIGEHRPDESAVEETFVNRNPASALKLGQARGVVLMTAAAGGMPVAEYPPNVIKKSVVGAGHAAKQQVQMMVRMLLPGIGEAPMGADAADALAAAVCHAHHRQTAARIKARIKEAV
jgi:crossover junction endodeoxyribonuclease RuvC